MQRFRKILVCVNDDSDEPSALGRAAALARRNGAALKLIAVVEPFPWYTRMLLPASGDIQGVLTRDKADRLEALAAPLRVEGREVTTEVVQGRAAIETVREAVRGGHDLVVKEAERHPGLLFGSADIQLMRDAPCPVWLVKPDTQDRPVARVLVAVDPSPAPEESDVLRLNVKVDPHPEADALNARLVGLGAELAEQEGAELYVLHVWTAPGESLLRKDVRLPKGQVEQYVEGLRAEAEKALGRLLARVPDPTALRRVHMLKGNPAEEIPRFARAHDVDLIVMGTVARTGVPGFLIGNTAEAVLRQVDCSVLAAKPEGFVSPAAQR